MAERALSLTLFSSVEDTGEGTTIEKPWSAIVKTFCDPKRWKSNGKKNDWCFIAGRANGRGKRNVVDRSIIVLDMDNAPNDWRERLTATGYTWLAYSTFTATPGQLKLRVMILLSRDVAPREYEFIARKLQEQIGAEWFDWTGVQPERLMYWPNKGDDLPPLADSYNGNTLDPDTYLVDGRDDRTNWPRGPEESPLSETADGELRDPRNKPGIEGAFCRVYSITDVLTDLLPGTYEPTDNPNRWTYADGTGHGGARIYDDDTQLYSEHHTDPANTRHCVNAFHLVRIHMFGSLEAQYEAPEGSIEYSTDAMTAHANADARVVAELEAFDESLMAGFVDESDETAEDPVEEVAHAEPVPIPSDLLTFTNEKGGHQVVTHSVARNRLIRVCKLRFGFMNNDFYRWAGSHWAACGYSVDDVNVALDEIFIKATRDAVKGFTSAWQMGVAKQVHTSAKAGNGFHMPALPGNVIGFENGVLDLDTLELSKARPDYATTSLLPYAWDADARCTEFIQVLASSLGDDAEVVEFVRAWINCAILQKLTQTFLLLVGTAGAGKGFLIRILEAVVGDGNVAHSTLKQCEEGQFETGKMINKRLIVFNEAKRSGRDSDKFERFKSLTGGDKVPYERKRQQVSSDTTFVHRGGTVVSANDPLQWTDDGLNRRRRTLAYTRKPEKVFTEQQELEFIRRQVPGICAWALSMSREDVDRAMDPGNLPRQMVRNNREQERESDTAAAFVMDFVEYGLLVADADAFTRTGSKTYEDSEFDGAAHDPTLYAEYMQWHADAGVSTRAKSPNKLTAAVASALTNIGIPVTQTRKRVGKINARGLTGVRIENDI